jgi:hypothetical protein
MLGDRLEATHPYSDIEVVSTAMAAVNSYTLLDFVDEIIEQKPDLILIYAGHNEYLGIMGVGSAFAAKGGRFATLMHLKLKDWRLYQLLQKFYSLAMSSEVPPDKSNKTLMSQVAKEKEEPFTKKEILPIIGCEFNVCKDMNDKSQKDNGYQVVLLAKTKKGYHIASPINISKKIAMSYY